MESNRDNPAASLPAIRIEAAGNFGNRLYRFMAATHLARRIGPCVISGADFPEWDMIAPPIDATRYRRMVIVDTDDAFDIDVLAAAARAEPSTLFHVRPYLQQQRFLLSVETYRAMLPPPAKNVPVFDERHLVINIRAGDILGGDFPFYTLVPIGFYAELIARTGLAPVFMGQLDDCAYVAALRERFPRADFMPSQGPIRDFDIIRSATHVVPSVSTFSVAAAWLSNAATVFLPLTGFLNPAHLPQVDLLPIDDPRYRFFLFPLNYALPERDALAHHATLEGAWRVVSPDRLRYITQNRPFLRRDATLAADRYLRIVDDRWYAHRHLDAAAAISDGWYADPAHHYHDIGRRLGYPPSPRPPAMSALPWPNVALGRPARQSSIDAWSKFHDVEHDARGAVNGDPGKDYGFHTALQDDPWWMVDLGADYRLVEIHIHNRIGGVDLRRRASPLVITASSDNIVWREIFRTERGHVFGSEDGTPAPLILRADGRALSGRYVKVAIEDKATILHLAEVEIYGVPP